MVQLNFKPKASGANILIYANQSCSLYVLKYLIKIRTLQNEIQQSKQDKGDEALKQAIKTQMQTKFDDIELTHLLEVQGKDEVEEK